MLVGIHSYKKKKKNSVTLRLISLWKLLIIMFNYCQQEQQNHKLFALTSFSLNVSDLQKDLSVKVSVVSWGKLL